MEYITASDIKRYGYCPKIIYFTHVLHLEERVTEAMEYGREIHREKHVQPLIAKIKPSKILRNYELKSDSLKITGKPDFILVTKFNEYIPVEVKWAEEEFKGEVRRDHKYQIGAYALLIDEAFKTTVKRGYIYYLRSKRIVEVKITSSLKKEVMRIIKKIYSIVNDEVEPKVKVGKSKCENCGWRKYCRGEWV